jgi:MFS family permease
VVALIPGLIAVILTFLLRDKQTDVTANKPKISLLVSFQYWKESPPVYKNLLPALLFFTLFNSSDLFLLLRAKEAGLTDAAVIGTYIFYNFVYAVLAYPLGRLSDTIGFRMTLIFGFAIYAIVYSAMAFSNTLSIFMLLFFLYGIYAAATESIAKAWITNICPTKDAATAIGTYTGFQSITAMLASSLAGSLWLLFGAKATFLITAGAAVLVVLYFNMNKVLKK